MDIALIACSLLLPEQRFFGFLIRVYLCSSAVPFYVPVPLSGRYRVRLSQRASDSDLEILFELKPRMNTDKHGCDAGVMAKIIDAKIFWTRTAILNRRKS